MIETERLLLRRWRAADRLAFAAINADARVCEFFPSTLDEEQSNAFADRIEAHFAEHGFGLWALQVKGGAPFAGYVGLSIPRFAAHFTPCVEIGWRLGFEHWNKGYAREAARAVTGHAFAHLGLPEIVSFPAVPEKHPLRPRVLYRMSRPDVL